MKRPNIVVFVGATVLFYAAMLFYFNAGDIFRSIESFDAFYLIPISVFICLSYAFKFGRWSFFVRQAGVDIPAAKLFPVFVASLSMLITPGKVGDVLKAYLLKKKFGYEQRATLPSIVMERVTDFPILAVLSMSGAYAIYSSNLVIAVPFLVLAALLFAIKNDAFFKCVIGLLNRISRFKKHADAARDLYANIQKAASYRNLLFGVIIGMPGWAVEGLMLYAILLGLGVHASIFLSISVYVISVIAGVLSFIPGGIGATEASMLGLLIITGVPKSEALAATIIFRALTLWGSLITGSLALSYVERQNYNVNTDMNLKLNVK